MKPSPPNNPLESFFWKNTDNSTPSSAARKPLFCTTISRPGVISIARIDPGKLDANAINPSPCAVYRFWNKDSPENILPNTFPAPPPTVSIFMFGVIQLIAPDSDIIVSPLSRLHTTAGNGSPFISYLKIHTSNAYLCLYFNRFGYFSKQKRILFSSHKNEIQYSTYQTLRRIYPCMSKH